MGLRIHQRPLADATFGWKKPTLSMQSFGAVLMVAGKRSHPSGRQQDLVGLDVPSGTENGTVKQNLRVKQHHICERKVAFGLPTGISDLAHSFGGARGQTTDSVCTETFGWTSSRTDWKRGCLRTPKRSGLAAAGPSGSAAASDVFWVRLRAHLLRELGSRFQLKCGRNKSPREHRARASGNVGVSQRTRQRLNALRSRNRRKAHSNRGNTAAMRNKP